MNRSDNKMLLLQNEYFFCHFTIFFLYICTTYAWRNGNMKHKINRLLSHTRASQHYRHFQGFGLGLSLFAYGGTK